MNREFHSSGPRHSFVAVAARTRRSWLAWHGNLPYLSDPWFPHRHMGFSVVGEDETPHSEYQRFAMSARISNPVAYHFHGALYQLVQAELSFAEKLKLGTLILRTFYVRALIHDVGERLICTVRNRASGATFKGYVLISSIDIEISYFGRDCPPYCHKI